MSPFIWSRLSYQRIFKSVNSDSNRFLEVGTNQYTLFNLFLFILQLIKLKLSCNLSFYLLVQRQSLILLLRLSHSLSLPQQFIYIRVGILIIGLFFCFLYTLFHFFLNSFSYSFLNFLSLFIFSSLNFLLNFNLKLLIILIIIIVLRIKQCKFRQFRNYRT